MRSFSNLKVHISDIPYEEKFGSSKGSEIMLGDYIKEVVEGEGRENFSFGGEYPWYVFKGHKIPTESEKPESLVAPSRFYLPPTLLDAIDTYFS